MVFLGSSTGEVRILLFVGSSLARRNKTTNYPPIPGALGSSQRNLLAFPPPPSPQSWPAQVFCTPHFGGLQGKESRRHFKLNRHLGHSSKFVFSKLPNNHFLPPFQNAAKIVPAVAMIPPTPSVTVPPDSSAQLLLRLGKPFVEFPRFSILALQQDRDPEGSPIPFSEWLTKRLKLGLPFVISDFDQLSTWPRGSESNGQVPGFGIERLIELSTKKNIPIRNCSTGRDLSFTLRKFADSARQSYQEFQNLYARDLQCPPEWLEQCRRLLPTEVQWGGHLDLFQWLPPCARSEVMMAYVGSEGSSSGFHRCFSSTVALNLLVEADGKVNVVILWCKRLTSCRPSSRLYRNRFRLANQIRRLHVCTRRVTTSGLVESRYR